VIAYFDASATVPLVVDEATTEVRNRLWTESTRVVSVRLIYPEARAALARAGRMGRLNRSQLNAAVLELDSLIEEVDVIELSPDIARTAGQIAQQHGLRGYDAVHLAAALAVADDDLVLVTGDLDLAAAAQAARIAISVVAPNTDSRRSEALPIGTRSQCPSPMITTASAARSPVAWVKGGAGRGHQLEALRLQPSRSVAPRSCNRLVPRFGTMSLWRFG
jgi:uncharacterized protein